MIKHVRKSFIKITMVMLTLMLIVPLVALNFITITLTYNNNKELLKQIVQTEIYVLSPHYDTPPPMEEDHVGIGKQYHTTIEEETTTTTAATIITTTTVKTKVSETSFAKLDNEESNQDNNNNNKTTTNEIPKETKPPAITDNQETNRVSKPLNPPWDDKWGNNGNDWQIPPPDHGNKPHYPNDNYNFDDGRYYNYNAFMITLQKLKFSKIFGALLHSYSIESSNNNQKIANTTPSIENDAATKKTTFTTTTSTIKASPEYSDKPDIEQNENKTRIIHKKIFQKNFRKYEPPKMDNPNMIDHFIVYIDTAGKITDVRGTDDYTVDSCTEIIESIDKKSSYDGFYNSLQYVKRDYLGGSIVVLSDRQSDIDMMQTMFFVSLGVFILMEGIAFIVTKLLTKRAMHPMQISYEKQQQFISDAGHELKTPLTVISANADILADEIGENKWLSYIKSQTERMRILVQEMLDLTKITNSYNHIAASRFNISSLVENVALPFECQAFEQNKTFNIDLEPNVEFFGNTERIRRMVGIFIDNAFKYSNENGNIEIQLKTENNKKVLKIYNTGIGIKHGEEEKIFERFYRSDNSRSMQGGYGLGLAIAKSIADQNNIKIQVQTEPGEWISFNLTL